MSFFVIGRGRADGLLRLLGQDVHETREEAVRAVQALTMAGAVSVDDVDVYIADLGSAAPVMIVGMPSPAPVEEATAGAWEAPAAAVVHDLPTPDPGDVLLADALQRAATRLESEGIVAPESVGFDEPEATESADAEPEIEPELEPEPVSVCDDDVVIEDSRAEPIEDETVADDSPERQSSYVGVVVEPGMIVEEGSEPEPESAVADDLSAVIASLGSLDSEPAMETVQDAVEVPAQDAGEWPWLNVGEVSAVESAETPADTAEPEAEPESALIAESEEPEPVVAPVLEPIVYDDSDTLIMTPALEDDFTPQPVIMGDYSSTLEATVPEVAADIDSAVGGTLTEAASLPEVAEPATVYEPAGDLTLDEYSCADCVYSNTCPKVNQTTPAECGAFQWKAI